jgi:phosphoketolase
MHRYWNVANYLTIGQIYLQDNPLLKEPLRPEHIKPRLLEGSPSGAKCGTMITTSANHAGTEGRSSEEVWTSVSSMLQIWLKASSNK